MGLVRLLLRFVRWYKRRRRAILTAAEIADRGEARARARTEKPTDGPQDMTGRDS